MKIEKLIKLLEKHKEREFDKITLAYIHGGLKEWDIDIKIRGTELIILKLT